MSHAQSDEHGYITSAFPEEQFEHIDGALGKMTTTGGRFKAMRLPVRLRSIERIVWFANLREQPKVLRYLLRDMMHIGKKTAHGHGRVKAWTVERIEPDYSWYADSESGRVLMRPLPISLIDASVIGYRQQWGGCVGPYWQRDFWREVAVPC